jgi:hypothetical protein
VATPRFPVFTGRRWADQAPFVLAIFVTAQVLDGVLTYWGLHRIGPDVEANTYLASAIQALGAAPVLFAAKSLGCMCGAILYITERYRALAISAGLYLGVAIIPWLLIILLHLG